MAYPIIRRPTRNIQRAAYAVARDIVRRGIRRNVNRIRNKIAIRKFIKRAGKRKAGTELTGYKKGRRLNNAMDVDRGQKNYTTVVGKASGTTHTTSRMIVRRTPREQRFLRKMFKNRPIKNTFVNRFGFAWMGAEGSSKTQWYSVCHLKYNNLVNYIQSRIMAVSQRSGDDNPNWVDDNIMGNLPDAFIYLGKCTFQYEIYNPTNYIITVYVYDLICKRDTPNKISYADTDMETLENSAPENCMYMGSQYLTENKVGTTTPLWGVADPTTEYNQSKWNTIGMKPTDYHYFNTFWKVKGMKKIILPPGASHHHTVIYNPKIKLTNARLFYPYQWWLNQNATGQDEFVQKHGVAGITQATLFGFTGQVAVENDQVTNNTNSVGTLPGKIVVNCIKKVNIWNMDLAARKIISENNLKQTWTKPTIMTDLVETDATAT